jgi:hypothetical protein
MGHPPGPESHSGNFDERLLLGHWGVVHNSQDIPDVVGRTALGALWCCVDYRATWLFPKLIALREISTSYLLESLLNS